MNSIIYAAAAVHPSREHCSTSVNETSGYSRLFLADTIWPCGHFSGLPVAR